MTDLLTTPIKISYIHPNGDHQALGRGDISATGEIIVTEALDGQGEYLDDLVTELNDRTYIVIKEPPPPGADRFSIGKRKLPRDSVEFILEFAAYAERVYSLALDFDGSVLVPISDDVTLEVEPIAEPSSPDPDGPTAPDALDDADDIDPDVQQILPEEDDTPAPVRPPSPVKEESEVEEIGDGPAEQLQP